MYKINSYTCLLLLKNNGNRCNISGAEVRQKSDISDSRTYISESLLCLGQGCWVAARPVKRATHYSRTTTKPRQNALWIVCRRWFVALYAVRFVLFLQASGLHNKIKSPLHSVNTTRQQPQKWINQQKRYCRVFLLMFREQVFHFALSLLAKTAANDE